MSLKSNNTRLTDDDLILSAAVRLFFVYTATCKLYTFTTAILVNTAAEVKLTAQFGLVAAVSTVIVSVTLDGFRQTQVVSTLEIALRSTL